MNNITEEIDTLEDQISKVELLLDSKDTSKEERDLLVIQCFCMNSYLEILGDRLKLKYKEL